MSEITLTIGHVARHTPKGAGAQGRDAALVDIGQDLLLRHLHGEGILEPLAFKGGTSLRKLYAGNAGRFSLDLDFASVAVGLDPEGVLLDLIAAVEGTEIGPFRYGVEERRGKWALTFDHDFGGSGVGLSSKLDLNPPPWLPTVRRGWQPLPVHSQYGLPELPELQIVRLEENLAEKVARLNRATPARDMYDLRWVMTHASRTGVLDRSLLRRLAVLKIWVDANGVHAGDTFWKPGHEGPAFDPERWLRDRSADDEFDEEDIGALAVPIPTATELSEALRSHFGFLGDLDEHERVVALAREQDRALALHLLSELPGGRLREAGLY
ncbi:nucleotidyl transferase AbiEii/AbiGii toxin family protein [Microbacterium sp. NPDC087665]|uniref:nucleotidyl transferase AbiEii/AbiGii toxin family protein n=1 Tax=Microbacterium sp. NPDC087665 TaxID=3364194 RepID=UPI0037F308CE